MNAPDRTGGPDEKGKKAETLSPIFPDDVEEAASSLLRQCCAMEKRLATAESCTGGLLASLLTDVAGASHAFERGFVVYSEESKCDLLGVRRGQIAVCGAVSCDVALAMAEGAIAQSSADVALAVTGYAGDAPPGEEAGLVHFACATKNGPTVHREEHFGSTGRGPVRIKSIRVALDMMKNALEQS
ncbi:CinA family protein [Sphingobium sp.]|uniref:CinA family protein n=1 Tax=Sphingobium sp. TaxID=1912891 RepID=UPI002BE9A4E1|nr:CinA family protein [Sphingobium sp.]HUD93367.1 CinA family protein [Sphingobium sp.]